jgi:hypothetical protein
VTEQRVIAQFPLMPGTFDLMMPAGAEVLAAHMYIDGPVLWALIDPAAALETRTFTVMATGHPFDPSDLVYLCTIVTGAHIAHLFERAQEVRRG